ncbi:undecaprenyldiphospho-muramoylpentapeptide beta-N-acetylglucosaminyltransferase [Advenella sp. WQ 585]|uniref:UDP-N-acetylglucosamine--N-acetylmuramyl-(pentapeptide) pyrophosphoryl-undecaprenol N-acetylglucosamine transferase n=1 Tax=Advenella mandrilli TaxID=2800330 RepID=A0ABS1EDE9_9BURK|nr:undecaprenyldiphospho-muramoylpentapeptide beta-N-acetylglucosaminyltransferase [Advenella mandrilli]MBK1781984.1 undecaprenyldiphospho-muramoylpentapeptide beta-N-acetylglucosaminyltransferase [Advenella mandrilli]
MKQPTLLVMAGGTGGHIMPGLAVAHEMEARGWQVVWLGDPSKMEGKLVPGHGFTLEPMAFSGVRGKGLAALVKLPFTLLQASFQAWLSLRKIKPSVVLGMGGYVAFPGGMMAALRGIPLVVHEQNAVAGTANKWLAKVATRVLTGFPGVLPKGKMVGNPVRKDLLATPSPAQRYASRTGRLSILVVGGSLGAHALNTVVPQALAGIAPEQRPHIVHQSGTQHLDTLERTYADLGVQAECVAFIADMAAAMSVADLLICRAGAMTVAEVAAVGVAALFIPLPHAIDDHQTANAAWLTREEAAWTKAQKELSAQWLASWLQEKTRHELQAVAEKARQCARTDATQVIADVCISVVKDKK